MAINRLEILNTQKGRYTYCSNPAGYVTVFDLAADTAEHLATPTGADAVFMSCVDSGGNPSGFWANFGADAAIPTDDVINGTGSVPNVGGRAVSGVNTVSVISPVDCKVVCEWYKIQD